MESTKQKIRALLENENEKKKFYDLVICKQLFKYARVLKIKNYKLLNKTELTDAVVKAANQPGTLETLSRMNVDNNCSSTFLQNFGWTSSPSPSQVLKCVLEKSYNNFSQKMTAIYQESVEKCKKKGKNFAGKKVGVGIGTDDCPMGFVLLKPGDLCCVRLSSLTNESNYEDFIQSVGSKKDQSEFLRLMKGAEEVLRMKDFAVESSLRNLMGEIHKNAVSQLTPIFSQKMNYSIKNSTQTLCEIEEKANTYISRLANTFGAQKNKIASNITALQAMLQQNVLVRATSELVGFGKKSVHKISNIISVFVAIMRWIYQNLGIKYIMQLIGRTAAVALKKAFDLTRWVGRTAWGASLKIFGWSKAFACFVINNPASSGVFLRLVNLYKRNLCRELGRYLSNQAFGPSKTKQNKNFLFRSFFESVLGEDWVQSGEDIFAKLLGVFENMLSLAQEVPEILEKTVKATENEFSVKMQAQKKTKAKNLEKTVAEVAKKKQKKQDIDEGKEKKNTQNHLELDNG